MCVNLGFRAKGFDKIFERCGKEFMEKFYSEFTYKLNEKQANAVQDIIITLDISKFLDLFRFSRKKKITDEDREKFEEENKARYEELENLSKDAGKKLAEWRVKIYSYLLDKTLVDIKAETIPEVISVHLNEKSMMHVYPHKDRIQVIYGVNFEQSTDIALARVFLQELNEAKRHVRNCLQGKVYFENSEVPVDIIKIDQPKNYSNGIVVFDVFTQNYNVISKKLHNLVNFRQYIQFHIHSIKAFLHIRMNQKGREIGSKIDHCKIIPYEYLKHLGTVNFFTNFVKKEQNKALFNEQQNQKVNV